MSCSGCGPLGTRFEQAREISKMLAEGHTHLAAHYEQIAADLPKPHGPEDHLLADDIDALKQLAAYHRGIAENVLENMPVYEEPVR